MQPQQRKKIEQTIAMLQDLLNGNQSAGVGGVQKITIPGFDAEVSIFAKAGEQLEPEIKELTHVLTEALGLMQGILNYSAAAKAPSDGEKKALQEKFMALSKRTENVEKNQNFIPHAKAVRELISVPYWVFTNSPQFIIKGGIEAADFNAIKFMKNKNQAHNDWYKSVGKAMRILEQFAKKEYSMGLSYNNNGTASWNDLISGSGSQGAQQTQHQPQQHQPQQQQQQVAPQQPQQQAPKPPKKELQGQNWLIANISKQKVTFGPGQVQMKHGFFIENCHDTVVTIDQKFKSLQMNKCTNVVLIVVNCISGVQLMNSQNIQVYVKGQTPSISIDKSQKVRVVLNEAFLGTDIVSSKVTECNITYEKNGNEAKSFMIAEQLITKWNNEKKKFQTVVYDKFL